MIMKQILHQAAVVAAAIALPAAAFAAPIEGKWKNAKGTVVVRVAPCGPAHCGTVAWASAHNRGEGVTPGTRVLSDLRPTGDGTYKGRAFEPKRDIAGSATVRQAGPNVMVVRACAIMGFICTEQRWTRVS
jgi:uncharacterized protein (DUF2147 family)